ncbi:MAG: cobalt-precorrin-4 C(11)-methyltransferase, partial [Deltaproteobacteria bacterium]|nr:cobalt-precorrin-4 C(11)-methyltransferase [Deltaproteobacteria bacterium]
MSGTVVFVGAGPGDPELLTLKAQGIIRQADLIIYAGSLVNPEVLQWAREGARIVDSAPMTLGQITDEMVAAAREDKLVARVHTGDPSLYGAIAEQMQILDRAD